jgi:aryl-alcohol dehydrogenase-like predicted oxidoreductase
MKHREWQQYGYVTSNMMYGCMEIGGSWDENPIDQSTRQRGFAALDRAREVGFDQFDHADIYCRGRSESVFGEWLSAHPGVRDEILI